MTLTSKAHKVDLASAGHETLRRMADVDHYNSWIYELMRPYVGRRVVEVGCGIGNMTGYFLQAEVLLAFDILPESASWVAEKFQGCDNLIVSEGDVCDEAFINRVAGHRFDTVVSTNMLEHVEQDAKALDHMSQLLVDGGYLLLFVPAGSYLFGSLDVALGHYRRYDKQSLASLVNEAGLHIEQLCYVNALGVVGWYLNSRILRRQLLPKNQLSVFNSLVPLLRRIEQTVPPPFGQSLLCVARKGVI